MTRAVAVGIVALASLCALSSPAAAQFYDCRGYPPPDALADLRAQVENVRQIERETADRMMGLSTQPYSLILDQLRAGGGAIADPFLLGAEDELRGCPNPVIPVRRTCAAASAALVLILEELSDVGAATREVRSVYTQSMRQCEQWTGLPPLQTALRVSD